MNMRIVHVLTAATKCYPALASFNQRIEHRDPAKQWSPRKEARAPFGDYDEEA